MTYLWMYVVFPETRGYENETYNYLKFVFKVVFFLNIYLKVTGLSQRRKLLSAESTQQLGIVIK